MIELVIAAYILVWPVLSIATLVVIWVAVIREYRNARLDKDSMV